MLNSVDQYFLQHEEPVKSYLIALREMILAYDEGMKEVWSYGMPFYYCRNKRVCYIWVHKKLHQPYLGIVDGDKIDNPELLKEKRSRMKILLFDPEKDIPVKTIDEIMKEALALLKYK